MQNIAILKAFCLPAGFAKLFSAWGDRKYWVLVCLGGGSVPRQILHWYYIIFRKTMSVTKRYSTLSNTTHTV